MLSVAIAALVVPAVLLVWLRLGTVDSVAELAPIPVPVEFLAEVLLYDDRQEVGVAVEWSEPAVVVAPQWQGTVTGVRTKSGEILVDGDVVVEVDGVARVAAVGEEALWRPIGLRDTGDDVLAVERFLGRLGYLAEPDSTYGSDTAAAVRLFAKGLGVTKPDGRFDPGWVLWIPENGFEVGVVDLDLGSPVPSQGSPLLIQKNRLSSLSINPGRSLSFDGEWILEIGGGEFSVVDGIAGESALVELSSILDPEGTLPSAFLRRGEPAEVVYVPAASVVNSVDGSQCVYLVSESGYQPTPVRIGSGSLGSVTVMEGLVGGETILANPAEIVESATCD